MRHLGIYAERKLVSINCFGHDGTGRIVPFCPFEFFFSALAVFYRWYLHAFVKKADFRPMI